TISVIQGDTSLSRTFSYVFGVDVSTLDNIAPFFVRHAAPGEVRVGERLRGSAKAVHWDEHAVVTYLWELDDKNIGEQGTLDVELKAAIFDKTILGSHRLRVTARSSSSRRSI